MHFDFIVENMLEGEADELLEHIQAKVSEMGLGMAGMVYEQSEEEETPHVIVCSGGE